MERIICKQFYRDYEKSVSEDQKKFSINMELIDKLQQIGCIKYYEENNNYIAEILVLLK